jgi:uncharacterized membrane protein/mono/diheme cytochrome c family protein
MGNKCIYDGVVEKKIYLKKVNLLNIISEFIGRFHPVVVHLPIGMLLLAIAFFFLSLNPKFEVLQSAVKYSLLFGSIGALLSCISGFLLSQSGEYDEVLVSRHQWTGIVLFAVSAVSLVIAGKKPSYLKIVMPVMLLLLLTTGHFGGTLTHGEGYLTNGLSANKKETIVKAKQIEDIQQAVVYKDMIQPILESKCYSCHGAAKQKGKLRLDDPSFILKGGEHAKAVVFGDVAKSEVIERIFLPKRNEEHMPPSQKPQLTNREIELINWWISANAGFDRKVADLPQPEKIKLHLAAYGTNNSIIQSEEISVPEKMVEKAPDSVLQKLRLMDVAVNPVAQNSNYLIINFIAVDSITVQHLQLIQKIRQQILWFKAGNSKINDSLLSTVGKLPSLTRLFLNNTTINDEGLGYFSNLSQLQYLNLSGTEVSFKGVEQLKGLKNLKQLFLYQTKIKSNEYAQLQSIFPGAAIDSGGYTLQKLATDTIFITAKPAKN